MNTRNTSQYSQLDTKTRSLYFKEYEKNNKKHRSEYRHLYYKSYNKRMREATLELLGPVCVRCGFNDKRALQVDHVNGDGYLDRKKHGHKNKEGRHSVSTSMNYKLVMASVLRKENRYQILCANCNWIKRVENDEIKKSRLPIEKNSQVGYQNELYLF